MAETVQRIRETQSHDGHVTRRTTEIEDPHRAEEHTATVADRLVWLLAGILLALLGLRFLLSLLGANASNGVANFVYSMTHPFVAPFFNLFNYNSIHNGSSTFEIYTLVAMMIYALIAAGLARLLTINRE